MHVSGGKPDRKEVRNMSKEKKAYIDKMVALAKETDDLSVLDLVCVILLKSL